MTRSRDTECLFEPNPLPDKVPDLSGVVLSTVAGSITPPKHTDYSIGSARAAVPMSTSSIFCVWCCIKPVAMAALVALAESEAEGLDTPIVELSRSARNAQLASELTLMDLQALAMPLSDLSLMEAMCLEISALDDRLVADLESCGVPVVPGASFHSEYSTWRLVSEMIEELTGIQSGSALNVLLSRSGLDIYFGIEPSSSVVHRIVDHFHGAGSEWECLSFGRDSILLSSWSMPLGGFATAVSLAEWTRLLLFPWTGGEARRSGELFPPPRVMDRIVGSALSGETGAVLGMRRSRDVAGARFGNSGWLGLSRLEVDVQQSSVAVVMANDLSASPERIESLALEQLTS